MKNRKRRLTAEQRLFGSFMLGGLAICVCIAVATLVVWDITHTYTVRWSHQTGDVANVRDWRGNPVPDEQWDSILAGKYEKIWVP